MSDTFDRLIGSLHGLPEVASSRPSTVRSVLPMLGQSQTFVVQTYRQKEVGDFIFVELVDAEGRARIVLPPKVADAIARQRDSLTAKVRSEHGKRIAQERKDAGEEPAFLRKKAGA